PPVPYTTLFRSLVRAAHQVGRVRPPLDGRFARDVVGGAGDQQRGAARVLLAQQAQGVGGGRGGAHGERVGGGAERGGEGGLVTVGHGEQPGGRAEQAGQAVPCGEQGTGAVLAAQAEGEGVVPGLGRGPRAFGGGGRLAGGGEPGLGLREPLPGRLVPLGQ